jgi:HEAT repeat protein
VPILPSAGRRIQELLQRLESPSAAQRESALAQLTLLGPRTIPYTRDFLTAAGATGRLAALELLERLGEVRGLDSVVTLTKDDDEGVARRAMEVAAAFPDPRAAQALRAVLSSRSPTRRRAAALGLGRLHRLGLVEAVEPLLGRLLDGDEDEALRLEVLESLSSLDRRALLPALKALSKDRTPAIVRAAAGLTGRLSRTRSAEPGSPAEADIAASLARLVSARTSPAEVPAIVDALVRQRSPALLPLLGRRLEALGAQAGAPGAEAIARAKANIHLALGALGSRIALHDLREMLKARPLHSARDLLAAAALVGDASLVPALTAIVIEEPRLLDAARTTFEAIARRANLRRTSRAVRSLGPEHKAAVERLWPTTRATPAGARRGRSHKLR